MRNTRRANEFRSIVIGLMRSGTGFNYVHDPEFRRKRSERCKKYLTRLAKSLGFYVMPSKAARVEQRLPEYLLDFCWMNSYKWGIELALEMEWDPHAHDVQYDFRKLIFIKAPRKIMLCAPWPGERTIAMQQMVEALAHSKYSNQAEQYAIIFFVHTKEDRELTRKSIESRAFLLDSRGRMTWQLVARKEKKRVVVRKFRIIREHVYTKYVSLLVDGNYRDLRR